MIFIAAAMLIVFFFVCEAPTLPRYPWGERWKTIKKRKRRDH